MGESPFCFRAMNLAMDEAVGKDFESGLSNLKEYVESLPDAAPEVAVERVQLESVPYY